MDSIQSQAQLGGIYGVAVAYFLKQLVNQEGGGPVGWHEHTSSHQWFNTAEGHPVFKTVIPELLFWGRGPTWSQ